MYCNICDNTKLFFILGLIGKKWFLFCVTPLCNLQFDKSYLNSISKQLNDFLMNHKMKNEGYLPQFSVDITTEEVQQKYGALKVMYSFKWIFKTNT